MKRRWLTVLILVIGIAALQMAIPLASYLNDIVWNAFWKGARWGWIPNFGPIQDYRQVDIHPFDSTFIVVCQYAIPVIILLAAFFLKMRPIVAMVLTAATWLAIVSSIIIRNDPSPQYADFTRIVIFSLLAALANFIILAVLDFVLPDKNVYSYRFDNSPGGVARHPWRAWIILCMAFIALPLARILAEYINSMIWEMLAMHFNTLGLKDRHDAFLESKIDDYYFEVMRCTLPIIFLYVVPFLFILWAIRKRMQPWYATIFGLITAIVLFSLDWLFESNYYIMYYVSRALLTGQALGVVGLLALWLYHSKVSKIQFIFDDE